MTKTDKERSMTRDEILKEIEAARQAEEITSDQARAASACLGLEGHDAMLANRVVSQGADPASLDYLSIGEVSDKILEAHGSGPGVYSVDDPDLLDYMALCALSADESQGTGSVRDRMLGFVRAERILGTPDIEFREAALAELGRRELEKIQGLPFWLATVAGNTMRVYRSDRGFAAATWAGLPVAAVLGVSREGNPEVLVGAPPSSPRLEEMGIELLDSEKRGGHFAVLVAERAAEIAAAVDG